MSKREFYPTFTGELPSAIFLHAGKHDEELKFTEQKMGWAGCLDAVELIQCGSTRRGSDEYAPGAAIGRIVYRP